MTNDNDKPKPDNTETSIPTGNTGTKGNNPDDETKEK